MKRAALDKRAFLVTAEQPPAPDPGKAPTPRPEDQYARSGLIGTGCASQEI